MQLLDSDEKAHSGEHARNLSAVIQAEELIDGRAEITVTLQNMFEREAYPEHSHDASDPATTQNGTPCNETTNADIFT